MWVSCTQWLLKTSHQVQGPYDDIKCMQPTCGFFGASRHVYGHQIIARRTGTRWKDDIKSFCVQLCRSEHQIRRLSLFRNVKNSRSNGRRADKACYCKCRCTRKLGALQACSFPDLFVMWLHGFTGLTSQYVCPLARLLWESAEIPWDPLMLSSLTFSNSLILYSHDSGWMYITARCDVTER